MALEISRQAAKAAEPCERALDDPSFRQDVETGLIRSIDDFNFPVAGSRGRLCRPRSTIAAVRKNPLDEGKQPTRAPVEDQGDAVAILDIRWMNRDAQQ